MTYQKEAIDLLRHADDAANWAHFSGDRDGYVRRVLLRALVCAVLALKERPVDA